MSEREHWQRLKALFAQSLEQPDAEREAWLQQQCPDEPELRAEVSRLLAQRRKSARILGDDALALLGRLLPEERSTDSAIGSSVGPYRLVRLLGEGGMGRVYLAERADGQFQQQAALKLIRSEFATPELHQRFLRERDTLAHLSHPHIAQLHDGGISKDGSPYFTLEFIDGEPITRWCDERRLDIRARVQLLLKVCDAVQYAHRNLVVHRDLKPSNILVTASGEPKLLDFGIAKPLAGGAGTDLTASQSRPMTPEYAAPEQVLGETVTTATDVYALGVLLYFLLCGRMPYRGAALGQSGWIKAILEEPPESLEHAVSRTVPAAATNVDGVAASPTSKVDAESIAASRSTSLQTLKRTLRGDLQRIVQRALSKAPEARYATVDAMADDLRAYLGGRALSGGTRTYRLRKFVRRHWLPLTAGATLFLVVLASAIGFAWQSVRIERNAQTASAVKDFVLDLFQKANPNVARGKVITLRDAVDAGTQRAERVPDDQPTVKAEILNTLGTIYYHLGAHQQAFDLHKHAFDLVKSRREDAVLAANAERFAGVDVTSMGDQQRGQELTDDAVRRLHETAAPRVMLARALASAGWVVTKREDISRLKQTSDEALALANQAPPDDEVTYLAMEQKGTLARKLHDLPHAVEYYQRALELVTRVDGVDEQQGITYRQQIGVAYGAMGKYAEARPYLESAFESAKRVFGENNSRALRIGEILGVDAFESGDVVGAEARFAHLIALAEAHTPPDESVLAELRLNHAEVLIDLGRYERAEPLLTGVRDFLGSHAGSDPAESSETMAALGELHLLTGNLDAAEREERQALAILTDAHMDFTAPANSRLCRVELARGQLDAALQSGREARDNAVKIGGERSHDTASAHFAYGLALAAANQDAEAENEFRAALHSYVLLLPPDGMHLRSAAVRLALAQLLAKGGRQSAESVQLVTQAIALHAKVFGESDPRTQSARDVLATVQSPH